MIYNVMNVVFVKVLVLGICVLVIVISGYFFLSIVSDLLNFFELLLEVFWVIWVGFGFVGVFFVFRLLENFI